MILCKGKDCNYRQVCSRFVIGNAMARIKNLPKNEQENNQWIDHCVSAKKFIRIGK